MRALTVATLMAAAGVLGQTGLATAAGPQPSPPTTPRPLPVASPTISAAASAPLDGTVVLRPDVLLRTKPTMSDAGVERLAALVGADRSVVFRTGTVTLPLPAVPGVVPTAGPAAPAPRPSPAPPLRTLPELPDDLLRGGLPLAVRPSAAASAEPLVPTAQPPTAAGPELPRTLSAVGVDAATFRVFAGERTGRTAAVWQAVSAGQAVVSHDAAERLGLRLGQDVIAVPGGGGAPVTLRIAAFATTGVPGTDLVLDDDTGRRLGLPSATGMLLAAADGSTSVELADRVRAVTGPSADVDLLTPPKAPTAFLTGPNAAKQFGAFSYRYFADGTIQPDADWVQANIRTETVPIMGDVTCHRLMLPQLRGALQEVQDAGLGGTLHTYSGCYVPRFIERNPARSISMHTWGIAIDMDAASNYRGIRGTMDPGVVAIFKRWGFVWGGDWAYTDPMHFELGALLDSPR